MISSSVRLASMEEVWLLVKKSVRDSLINRFRLISSLLISVVSIFVCLRHKHSGRDNTVLIQSNSTVDELHNNCSTKITIAIRLDQTY